MKKLQFVQKLHIFGHIWLYKNFYNCHVFQVGFYDCVQYETKRNNERIKGKETVKHIYIYIYIGSGTYIAVQSLCRWQHASSSSSVFYLKIRRFWYFFKQNITINALVLSNPLKEISHPPCELNISLCFCLSTQCEHADGSVCSDYSLLADLSDLYGG